MIVQAHPSAGPPQGLPDTGQPLEHPDGGEDLRRVGALPASGLPQALLAQACEERLKPHVRGLAGDQAGAKLAQHGGIQARGLKRERQGILPSEAAPDMVCRWAIRKPCEQLEDGDAG
jgi:hypothetical protein